MWNKTEIKQSRFNSISQVPTAQNVDPMTLYQVILKRSYVLTNLVAHLLLLSLSSSSSLLLSSSGWILFLFIYFSSSTSNLRLI